MSRVLPAILLAASVLLLPACAAPTAAPGGTGTGINNGSSTDGTGSVDVSGPQAADCPQGLRDLAEKYPEETLTGKEISLGTFLSGDDAKYVAVGLAPSCVFESTQNNIKHSAFYFGEGKDFVATLGARLAAEGLKPADYNTDSMQNWATDYRTVVVSVEHYSVGDQHSWSSVDFKDEFVWVFIATLAE